MKQIFFYILLKVNITKHTRAYLPRMDAALEIFLIDTKLLFLHGKVQLFIWELTRRMPRVIIGIDQRTFTTTFVRKAYLFLRKSISSIYIHSRHSNDYSYIIHPHNQLNNHQNLSSDFSKNLFYYKSIYFINHETIAASKIYI